MAYSFNAENFNVEGDMSDSSLEEGDFSVIVHLHLLPGGVI